jgi:hypothetical protein
MHRRCALTASSERTITGTSGGSSGQSLPTLVAVVITTALVAAHFFG